MNTTAVLIEAEAGRQRKQRNYAHRGRPESLGKGELDVRMKDFRANKCMFEICAGNKVEICAGNKVEVCTA